MVQMARNDVSRLGPHNVDVTDTDEPDWYLQEWAELSGKRQADLASELGLLKNHAHRIWHSKQPYRRDIVNAVAKWLQIRPYELLMPPEEALQLRQLRESAMAIAAGLGRNSGSPLRSSVKPEAAPSPR